jgi:D-psicose/D-tagatose/L-ribulose 3-epimerase
MTETPNTPTGYGVVTGPDRLDAVRASVADYVEPSIVGGLLVEHGGAWSVDPVFVGDRYPSFALLFPGTIPLSDPRAPIDHVWAYLDQALPAIASVAVPGARIVFGSGTARRVPDGVDRADAIERFAEVVAGTRDRAAALGLRIVLEPLNRGETDLVNSIDEAVGFLDRHGIDGVDVVADLFHVMTEQEPFEHVRRYAGRIGHVHLADGDRRFVGAGGFPWREFLQTLDDAGYTGSVSLECRWGDDFATELATSLALVSGRPRPQISCS